MKEWNNDKELFELVKRELYTPVIGDILDGMFSTEAWEYYKIYG